MKNHSALVHFDWAVKRLLRNKLPQPFHNNYFCYMKIR